MNLLDRRGHGIGREPQPLDDVVGRMFARSHPEHEAVVLDPLVGGAEGAVGVRILGEREGSGIDHAASFSRRRGQMS